MAQLSVSARSSMELLRRYLIVTRQAWHERKQQATPRRLTHELAFLPANLELVDAPPHPAPLWTGRLLSAMLVLAVLLAAFGRIDIVAKAPGKVILSSQTKTIASVDTAAVRVIHVAEGQRVQAGDSLIELDATPLLADRDKATGEEGTDRLQVAQSRALLAAIDTQQAPILPKIPGMGPSQVREAQQHLAGQYADYIAKLGAAETAIAQSERVLQTAHEREKIYSSLLAQSYVSRDAWLEKQQARIEIESRLADARAARDTLIADIRRQLLDTVAEATKAAEAAHEDALHASAHANWLTLRSPVSGTVQQLSVHTVGGVVAAAEPLMRIVPDEAQVEVEASLDNKDIGFVTAGQQADIKVETFDYTKYGTLPARVEFISRDAVEDKKGTLRYTVRLLLERSTVRVNDHTVSLSPGMAVNVDIRTGRRRVLDYFLSPLLRGEHESLHER